MLLRKGDFEIQLHRLGYQQPQKSCNQTLDSKEPQNSLQITPIRQHSQPYRQSRRVDKVEEAESFSLGPRVDADHSHDLEDVNFELDFQLRKLFSQRTKTF